MKVKRTCGNCGAVWYAMDGCVGCLFPTNILRIIFNAFYTTLTKGSAIDMEYMNSKDEKIKKTCPNCNYSIYNQERASMTCGEIGCMVIFFLAIIVAVILLL